MQGDRPDWPVEALTHDFETIRHKVAGQRADTTTPDTRLAGARLTIAMRRYANQPTLSLNRRRQQ